MPLLTDLLHSLAQYLDEQGLLTYDPDSIAGDTFVETLPPEPAEAVGLWLYDSGAPGRAQPVRHPLCAGARARHRRLARIAPPL